MGSSVGTLIQPRILMNQEAVSPKATGRRNGYLFAGLTVAIWTGFVLVSRMAGKGTLNAFDVAAMSVPARRSAPRWS